MQKYVLPLAFGLLLPPAAHAQDVSSGQTAASASDTASYIEGGKWTYPSLSGMLNYGNSFFARITVDCALLLNGHVDGCYAAALDDKTDKKTRNIIGTAYQQYAVVDPTSIQGGIQPDDRVQFHYDWTNLPASDIDDAKELPVLGSGATAGTWSFPTGEEMAASYPPDAVEDRVDDTVMIYCQLAPNGSLSSCQVLADLRPKYGFGKATANLFVGYSHVDPATVSGGIQPGAYHLFTYKWSLGQ